MELDQYPKWKYGKNGAAQIVQDEEAEKALEGKWYDSPADVPTVKPAKADVPTE